MNNSPFFSVIIPTYNRQETLLRAIESVLNQTYKNFELIIVDDGSSDNTSKLLSQYQHLKIIKTDNQGVSKARNKGVYSSLGKWIAFLDSDDEWLESKLEKQYNFIENNPQYKIIHGEEIWIRNGVRVNPKKKHKKGGGDQFLESVDLCVISPSCVVIEKDFYGELKGFDENFEVCEDYDLWLRITSYNKVGHIEDYLINKYGGHEDQLSRKYKAMDYWRVKALDKLLSNNKQLPGQYKNKATTSLLKRCEILLNGYKKFKNTSNQHEIECLYQKYLP